MSDRISLTLVAGQQDEQGRITSTRQMWPVDKRNLKAMATWAEREGLLDKPSVLELLTTLCGQGLEDTPEVREALGLPPRLVVTRNENEATGVAGVEQ